MTDRRYRFRRKQRVRRGKEFRRIYSRRCSVRDPHLLVFAAPNDFDYPRLGLSVSKKRVGIAVKRNRWKRKLREAFRLSQHELPAGLDLVVIPQRDTPPELETLKNSLKQLARRAEKKLEKQAP